jgi:hypothetical protein
MPAKANGENVMNGIAYDAEKKRLFVTGKLWPKIYEVKVIPARDAGRRTVGSLQHGGVFAGRLHHLDADLRISHAQFIHHHRQVAQHMAALPRNTGTTVTSLTPSAVSAATSSGRRGDINSRNASSTRTCGSRAREVAQRSNGAAHEAERAPCANKINAR